MSQAQYSVAVRNARLAAWYATIGADAQLLIYTGTPPLACSSSPTGTLLLTFDLAGDWMGSPSGGTISAITLPIDATAVSAGIAGYYRLLSSGDVCGEQGTITGTTGGGVMTMANPNIASGQVVPFDTFSKTEPGE